MYISLADNLTPKHTKTNRIVEGDSPPVIGYNMLLLLFILTIEEIYAELSIWIPIGGLLGLGAMIMIAS